MGLAAIDFFVGLAGGAYTAFEMFDQPVNNALLLFSGMLTDGTGQTTFGKFSVLIGDFGLC